MKNQYEAVITKYIPANLRQYMESDSIDKDCLERIAKSESIGVLKDYIYTLEWRQYVANGKIS